MSTINPNVTISIRPEAERFVKVRLENIGLGDCLFRKPHSGLGKLDYDSLSVKDRNGKEVQYKGDIVPSENYVHLSAKEVNEFYVDLSKNYKVEENETYTISYKMVCEPDIGAFSSDEKAVTIGKKSEKTIADEEFLHSKVGLDSEATDLLSNPNRVSKGGFQFLEFNNKDIEDILATLKELKNALKSLEDKTLFKELYYKHICSQEDIEKYTEGGKEVERLHKNVMKVLSFLEKGSLLFYSAKNELRCLSNPGIGGYVRPGDTSGWNVQPVYLCEAFQMADQFPKTIGNPSKLGIIVHELFHLANPRIVDHYYGYTRSISSPLPLDACLARRDNTKCIDMYQIMQNQAKNKGAEILPIESSKVNDWKIYQMEAGKKVNLNMYTADCLRFLVEDAFLLKQTKATNSKEDL